MEKVIKIIPPTMPNFFRYEMPTRERQDGFKGEAGIPISDLSEEEAIEFGEMMKQEFIKHWKKRTKSNG